MRSLIRDLQSDLKAFLKSRDNVLLVCCEHQDSALLLKTLEAIEDAPSNPDIFLKFSHEFETFRDYVAQVRIELVRQQEEVNRQLAGRNEESLAPVPDLPGPAAPADLLSVLMRHVRKIVPKQRRVIWLFYPSEVERPGSYAELGVWLWRHFQEPGLENTKALLRDGTVRPMLSPMLGEAPGVRVYEPKLDRHSLFQRLSETANHPKLSSSEQAEIQMMLAGLDVSSGRFEDAALRNRELLAYFSSTGQGHHESIVMNNLGDLYYLQGRYAEAQAWYERAVAKSLKLDSAALVLYQALNLGNALMVQGRAEEARVYYEAAGKLAESTSAPLHRIQALERLGMAKSQCGRPKEAVEAWEQAAVLSRKYGHDFGVKSNLERLRPLYVAAGDLRRVAQCDHALEQLERSPAKGGNV